MKKIILASVLGLLVSYGYAQSDDKDKKEKGNKQTSPSHHSEREGGQREVHDKGNKETKSSEKGNKEYKNRTSKEGCSDKAEKSEARPNPGTDRVGTPGGRK
jgi:hypothetical protein